MTAHENHATCACCSGQTRREFILTMSAALGALALAPGTADAADALAYTPTRKEGAKLRVAFLYPPTSTFRDNPEGWWSWPGTDYDAEGHQKRYTAELRRMEKELGAKLQIDEKPVASTEEAQALAREVAAEKPDGVLLIVFYNLSLPGANVVIEECARAGVPVICFVGLGVHHGNILAYRRPGLYFIQAMDDFEAIEGGLRMAAARRRMREMVLLSVYEAPEIKNVVEPFTGITVRTIPFAQYAEEFKKASLDGEPRRIIKTLTRGAREVRGVTPEAIENALRAHIGLKTLLAREGADAVTMNCLRRGMLKPCISFSMLNGQMIPATCENDLTAAYSQILGQLLTGRPGFQHNPCYETEKNHYYGSHCTCTTKLRGAGQPELPYLLRRFMHTNEGSCAIQVFWPAGEPVTMIHFYPGAEPKLDVYAGEVVGSHEMPPGAGCTTNVEIKLTDRPDAMTIKGHHNILFCGDFARRFRQFANLYGIQVLDEAPIAPAAEAEAKKPAAKTSAKSKKTRAKVS